MFSGRTQLHSWNLQQKLPPTFFNKTGRGRWGLGFSVAEALIQSEEITLFSYHIGSTKRPFWRQNSLIFSKCSTEPWLMGGRRLMLGKHSMYFHSLPVSLGCHDTLHQTILAPSAGFWHQIAVLKTEDRIRFVKPPPHFQSTNTMRKHTEV